MLRENTPSFEKNTTAVYPCRIIFQLQQKADNSRPTATRPLMRLALNMQVKGPNFGFIIFDPATALIWLLREYHRTTSDIARKELQHG